MATAKKLGNFSGNDIELCRTTNIKVGNQTAQALIEAQIPFSKSFRQIPFYQRIKYRGAKEEVVIMINPNRYGQARRVIDQMEYIYKKKLVVSNY